MEIEDVKVGDTIHRWERHWPRSEGYPQAWSAKVLAVIQDDGATFLVCRRWNQFKRRHAHWLVDKWEFGRSCQIGPLPRK